jgi:hypothetical protein
MFTYAMSNEVFVTELLRRLGLDGRGEQFIEWLKENKKNVHNTK